MVKVRGEYHTERVVLEKNDLSQEFYNKSAFGSVNSSKQVELSLIEALYLLEKDKIEIFQGKKKITFDQLFKKARKLEPNIWTKYVVFKDFRDKGYVIKTALKYGADFRVYDRGIKPGQDHAKWIIYPVSEGETLTWQEFSSKNRVAHSTKKRLLIGVVDAEGDVTYYEIAWKRP